MEITLRDVTLDDADVLAHVLIAAGEHAFRGRVPDVCLEFTEAESSANWRKTLDKGLADDEFIVLAVTPDGLLVGYAWGRPNTNDARFAGELKQIFVLPDYQGRGVGRRLICNVAQRLADEQQIRSLMVEVMHVNPNRAFYERLGAQFVSDRPHDWSGVPLTMDVYGWTDTRLMVATQCGQTLA